MAGGSFVGGSSPVAGGTIGFPVLVYVFDQPASLSRSFSLAIQSIGMASASVYILTRGRTIEWRILRFALLGSAAAMPVGMCCVAPNVAEIWVKILFSVVYASFGLLHLVRLRGIVANEGPSGTYFAADPAIGFVVGALGGLPASVIGVGADILLYGTLVLLYHTDIKVAIPTSVILMAFTSVVGVGCSILATLFARRLAGIRSSMCFPTGWRRLRLWPWEGRWAAWFHVSSPSRHTGRRGSFMLVPVLLDMLS